MSDREERVKGDKSPTYRRYRPLIGIAVVSLLICGIFFPLLITGVAQTFLPNQANGDLVKLNGRVIGSNLIDNNFTLPIFFHGRGNNSASGVDPDITMPDAYSQAVSISNATGIGISSINQIINQNQEGTFWIFGSPYVNVLNLNLKLIQNYPLIYKNYTVS
ncbi:MAG: potassium-transporting ATPase subunit C [Thaumarchaeota archaeon]|nr:potassium-transporting ATPase subunit C [Nitrososphaerota archaeon]